jgi:hemerythrin-like domain-containing protein
LRRVAGTGPVLDRLTDEHEVIADLLDHLDRALVSIVADEDAGTAQLQDVLDLVTDALLSHLAYEERELLHPLAQAGFQ